MHKITRRSFLLSAAALPAGCALRAGDSTVPESTPVARLPAVGQSWRYAKRDLFTHSLVDTQDDTVASVGVVIEIASRTESDSQAQGSSTGSLDWLKKYFVHPVTGKALPSEIQKPWGMVLVDPHWSQVQVFETPIPLWPRQLRPGWHEHFVTQYKTSEESRLPWEQTMKAEDWETITVPAGEFKTLRFTNLINFTSSDLSRTNSIRRETLWLAPEIGRWVARESRGTYYFDESVADDQNNESSYRWELLAWT